MLACSRYSTSKDNAAALREIGDGAAGVGIPEAFAHGGVRAWAAADLDLASLPYQAANGPATKGPISL